MAYGLKYYKEFAWTNYANDTTGNTRIEILENNYSGSSVEIDELGETPVQLRMDNTGDMINQTIKKTSLVLSIVDTDQFDYSEFYTSDGKKYKVNLISSVANWTGYLVPQSFGQELGINGLISITASDGLHLLQSIDYVADKNKTLKLADFIADIETKIGLGTFDRSVSLATDKGDLWQQFIYEGMFLDKNYEDCLDMVLTSYGLQVRYWKLFPVTSILSHSFSGSVKCLDNVPMVDYLPIAKKLKINQNLTALPDILEDAMVDDATDVIKRTPSLWKLAKWVDVSDNGLPVYPYKDRHASENMYKAISMYAIPTNAPYDTQRITGHEGSKYVLREFDSTPFQIEFNANFGRLSVYGRSSATGYQEKLSPISWSELHWGLYDTKTNKSFSKATNSWSITGRPTYSTANILRVDNPADSDVTVYINVPKTTGDVLGLELFLFTPSFAYHNPAAEATSGIFSINSIKIAEVGGVSENELYSEIKGTITVGDNIDVIDYDYELGTSPSYPTNTSLYYGSSLYNNIYDQITSFTLAGNSVNQMQYLANTILYSNGAGRKSVFSGTFAPMNNGNLMFYRADVNNVNCLINSFTLDVRRVKFVDAEFVEIAPFTFTNYTITSESSIGSSDWGGSGGSSGTVGGGSSTVDTSNFAVKTGAVTQNIEGSVTVEGAVVAGSTNGVLPDDLPVATGSLYGVVKIDDVTIKIDANGKIYAIATGGVSSWNDLTDKPANLTALAALTGAGIVRRNSDSSFSIDTSVYLTAITKTMVENVLTGNITTHTHNYLPISGGDLTGELTILTNKVWHAGNDGSGSGLDAGLLCGRSDTGFFRVRYGYKPNINDQSLLLDNSTCYWTPDTVGNPNNGYGVLLNISDGIAWFNQFGFGTDNSIYFRQSINSPTSFDAWKTIFHSGNSNLKTVDWYAKNLYGVNGIFDGAVVAGALNNTLPDDLPIATSSLYGVVKFDAATLGLNGSGQLTVIGGGWSNVSWGTPTSQYSPLTINSVTRNLSVDGHTHSQYLLLSGGIMTGKTVISTVSGIINTDNYTMLGYDSSYQYLGAPSLTTLIRSGYDTNLIHRKGTLDFKIWDESNDGAGSGLDADLLDGVHYQNILERRNSGSSDSGTATGWFRIGALLESDAGGYNCILIIKRNYDYANNEVYVFSISGAYNGGISITQLSGYANYRLIDKVRIDYTNGRESYIELHIATSTTNNSYGWTTIGAATSYTTWTAVSDTPVGTSYEFTTVNGCKSDRGFTGNLSGNSSSAAKLQTARTIWGQSFNGEGNVSGAISGATTGTFSSTISATTGIFSNLTANYIPKHTAGGLANSLIYDNGTNVGIGRANPGYKLDVNGAGRFSNSVIIDSTTYEGFHINSPDGGLGMNRRADNALGFYAGNNLYASLKKSGNFIIGTSETDYGYKLDVNGTLRATGAAYLNSTLSVTGASTFTGLLTANGGINATTGTFSSYVAANRIYTGYDSGIANSFSCSNWFRSNGTSGWYNDTYGAGILSDTANIVRTYSTNKFKVYNTAIDSILTLGGVTAANVVSSGAVVAGALNGTLPDDLPVATSSVFGVVKTGASINNNAGVINLNGRHYTTTSTYTDSAVREITAEIALGTGSMANGTLDQIQLSFAPLTTTRGLTANVIATNTGAGMGLKLSFRKDAGTGRWYIMIYNDSGAAVTRDGILLSIRGQQTI